MTDFDMLNFDMSLAPGRTYRYYTKKPVYPFGHGLSYTSFKAKVDYKYSGSGNHTFSLEVQNSGQISGDEV